VVEDVLISTMGVPIVEAGKMARPTGTGSALGPRVKVNTPELGVLGSKSAESIPGPVATRLKGNGCRASAMASGLKTRAGGYTGVNGHRGLRGVMVYDIRPEVGQSTRARGPLGSKMATALKLMLMGVCTKDNG